jgi:EAL domain-containing protein (putative c-di-GMP-specific phosphodiesterase class I)
LDDNKTILPPANFLQIAKKLKLYPKLSKIMLQKSFEKFKDSDKRFSVNISLNDIMNIETVKYIEELIKNNKDIAKRLIFEILESEGIEDFDITKKFIEKVRKMGVKIAIDDFGSGYSSFRYISEIQPDIIKIDGSLIREIIHNKNNLIMVKNIIAMAKDLKITTVAEFVSSKEIFDMLKELDIDEYQGYYIGKPSKDLL